MEPAGSLADLSMPFGSSVGHLRFSCLSQHTPVAPPLVGWRCQTTTSSFLVLYDRSPVADVTIGLLFTYARCEDSRARYSLVPLFRSRTAITIAINPFTV